MTKVSASRQVLVVDLEAESRRNCVEGLRPSAQCILIGVNHQVQLATHHWNGPCLTQTVTLNIHVFDMLTDTPLFVSWSRIS